MKSSNSHAAKNAAESHGRVNFGEIRDTVNRGWPLGSERFKDEIERALACTVRPPKPGRPTRSIMLQGKPFG